MKKIYLFMSFNIFTCYATEPFQFKSYKDENGFLTPSFLNQLAEVFHPDIFFETGTYSGQTTEHAAPYFKRIHTVELFEPLYIKAKNKLAPFSNITVHQGKSNKAILQLRSELSGTIMFWLDAHYSGEGTGRSSANDRDPNAFTAIRDELHAIKALNKSDLIILIDDMRGFGTTIGQQKYFACWCYPTIQEIQQQLLDINPRFAFALVGDIFCAYDSSKYNPQFSDVVIACTKSRLYDGQNLSDAELLDVEQTIMYASSEEREFIIKLCEMITDYRDPVFWYDLCYGLVQLGNGQKDQARTGFNKVKKEVKNLQEIDPSAATKSYDHWRLQSYLNICSS